MRKLIGWERFDTPKAIDAINNLYGREWRLMMNLFQPSLKLARKVRVGSRLTRKYDMPQTPLDRLLASGQGYAEKLKSLKKLRETLNPFELACSIDRKLEKISRLASPLAAPPTMSQRKLQNAPAHAPSHLQIGPPEPTKPKTLLSTNEKNQNSDLLTQIPRLPFQCLDDLPLRLPFWMA